MLWNGDTHGFEFGTCSFLFNPTKSLFLLDWVFRHTKCFHSLNTSYTKLHTSDTRLKLLWCSGIIIRNFSTIIDSDHYESNQLYHHSLSQNSSSWEDSCIIPRSKKVHVMFCCENIGSLLTTVSAPGNAYFCNLYQLSSIVDDKLLIFPLIGLPSAMATKECQIMWLLSDVWHYATMTD